MSISRANERNILTKDQFNLVSSSHHPAIYDADTQALRDLRRQLRDQHAKVKTQVRQRQRETRGKSEPRGKSFPGTTEQPLKQKQIIAGALKRVNKELERLRILEARTAHVEAAHRALAAHRTSKFERPTAGKTANEGMQPQSSVRRRKFIPGSQIGSVSQATKVSQAIRDNRG